MQAATGFEIPGQERVLPKSWAIQEEWKFAKIHSCSKRSVRIPLRVRWFIHSKDDQSQEELWLGSVGGNVSGPGNQREHAGEHRTVI